MGSGFVIAPASRTHAPAIEDALAPFRAQLEDPLVTDVFVNGSRGMFIDRGSGTEPVAGWTASEREVRELACELIAQGGRHVDDAHPCVDVRLRGGIRVHAVLAPIATAGTTLSIRIPRFAATTLATLVAQGMIDRPLEAMLREAVSRRANLLVSGAAGAGKTTLLSALLGEAAPTERIVTIEDVAEIALDHPHHVALESRQANLEGAGEVGLARLVREALRMKPDRLVIGECRGAEVRELLSALNTGHDGGAGTVHANSLADVATRLEALGALAGLDETTLARQVTSAIEFVIHLERDDAGRRHVAAVGEFRIVDGRLFVVPKDVPQTAEVPPTRRSRRQARGGSAGAASAAAPVAVPDDGLVSDSAAPGDGEGVMTSGFVPHRESAAVDSPDTQRGRPLWIPRALSDGGHALAAVARSPFTPDGEEQPIAVVDAGLLPEHTAAENPPGAPRPIAEVNEAFPATLRRRTQRGSADDPVRPSSPPPTAERPVRGGLPTVLPTFDQWRERLGVPRQANSSAGSPSGAVASEDHARPGDHSAQTGHRPQDGGRARGEALRRDGHNPRRDPGWRDDRRLREERHRRGGDRAPDALGAQGEDGSRDDGRTWSEQSMRAQRASRTVTALTPAELDAQWTRLVEGWEASPAPAHAAEGVSPSGPTPAPRASQPDRRGGGAWSFVPEPAVPAGTRSATDASS
ncbi:TadA family conjugal transfer-associated ATPase [Microbacterium nymphoidis]|uniref:TadA family conjugal transfer-associated ATPase n=1 Tax=Microbacterium nymphoidis TaxID=2898586 RepID=UPI0027DED931|nr:TadA family conjugal transfer-associated ATPase [Microbacterium nymphoidis]